MPSQDSNHLLILHIFKFAHFLQMSMPTKVRLSYLTRLSYKFTLKISDSSKNLLTNAANNKNRKQLFWFSNNINIHPHSIEFNRGI